MVKYGEIGINKVRFTLFFTINSKFTLNNGIMECSIMIKVGITTKQRMFRAQNLLEP